MSMEGHTIGNYRIETLLGSSSTGRVFRAVRMYDGQPAAVKVISSVLVSEAKARTRVRRNLDAAKAVGHPNVVEIFEVGEERGFLYLAMELCPHGSLRTLLERAARTGQPLPADLSHDLMRQAADGLGFLHNHGLIHGGLTPENLLLKATSDAESDARWRLKISGLGLASIATPITAAEQRPGGSSISYWPPERWVGGEPDARSDVYSLGVILYEMATSFLPIVYGQTDGEGADGDLIPPGVLNHDLPPSLERVILRCLAREPGRRFADGEEVAAALSGDTPPRRSSGRVDQVAGATASPTLDINSIDDPVTLFSGQETIIPLTVANHGGEPLDVEVTVGPSPVVNFPDLPRLLRLDSGQQKTISASVRLDAQHAILPGEYRVRIQARSKAASAVRAETRVVLGIVPRPVARLNLRPLGQGSRHLFLYQVEILNIGTSIQHFTLQASDALDQLGYRFRPEMVTVEPRRSRTITLGVVDRQRESALDSIEFEVSALPSHGPPATASGEYRRPTSSKSAPRRALVSFGALGVVAIILMALLVGSFMRNQSTHSAALVSSPTTANNPMPTPTLPPTPTPTSQPAPTPTAQPTPTRPALTPSPTVLPATGVPIVVRRLDTTSRRVALTFSIGDDPSSTAKLQAILKILGDRNVHATFGVTGVWAADHPNLIRAIVAGGHQLVNETYDHASFTGASVHGSPLSSAEVINELTRADDIIRQITGQSTRPYYRPPYGDIGNEDNSSVVRDAATAGYSVAVLWTIDTMSWSSSQTVGKMISTASDANPGDIILFNVSPGGGNKDVSALPQVIDNLHGAGFEFATVKQMVGR